RCVATRGRRPSGGCTDCIPPASQKQAVPYYRSPGPPSGGHESTRGLLCHTGGIRMPKRKRKSKWIWILVGLLVPLAMAPAGLTDFLLWPRGRVTWEGFERLQPGMSRAEAEALLGPAKPYRRGPKGIPIAAVPWASGFRKGPIDNTTFIQPTHIWKGKLLTI